MSQINKIRTQSNMTHLRHTQYNPAPYSRAVCFNADCPDADTSSEFLPASDAIVSRDQAAPLGTHELSGPTTNWSVW